MEKIIVDTSKKMRLDIFLFEKGDFSSRSQVKKLFDEKLITVNGEYKKSGYMINEGDIIEFEELEKPTKEIIAQEIPLDIIFEDDDIIVINKPQGLVVHPGAGNFSQTLVNALKFYTDNLSDINGEERMGIVHRIDKDTSGLLVVAKNNDAHASLQKQIAEKSCKRFYMALLEGILKEKSGVIDKNLRRSMKDRTMIEVCPKPEGREAITHYNVLQEFSGYSLVKFELKTGRTHQIRVHAKSLGHPVVGDETYGKIKNKFNTNGQLLHAYKLQLTHPRTNEFMTFEIPLPDYFNKIIEQLEREY